MTEIKSKLSQKAITESLMECDFDLSEEKVRNYKRMGDKKRQFLS